MTGMGRSILLERNLLKIKGWTRMGHDLGQILCRKRASDTRDRTNSRS